MICVLCFISKDFIFSSPSACQLLILFLFLIFPFLLMTRSGFNWTLSMKVMAARMIFHLFSMLNRQVYAHMLIYLRYSVSPLHNGVKIFLMRNDVGIVTFSCNNKGKINFFLTFFFPTPLFYLTLTEFNSICVLPSSL